MASICENFPAKKLKLRKEYLTLINACTYNPCMIKSGLILILTLMEGTALSEAIKEAIVNTEQSRVVIPHFWLGRSVANVQIYCSICLYVGHVCMDISF